MGTVKAFCNFVHHVPYVLQLLHLQRLLPGGRTALVWIKVLLFLVSSVCFWICEAAEWAGECTSALRMLGIVRTCAQLRRNLIPRLAYK